MFRFSAENRYNHIFYGENEHNTPYRMTPALPGKKLLVRIVENNKIYAKVRLR